jgi:hypothetical protein
MNVHASRTHLAVDLAGQGRLPRASEGRVPGQQGSRASGGERSASGLKAVISQAEERVPSRRRSASSSSSTWLTWPLVARDRRQTVTTSVSAAHVVELLIPELLEKPVRRISDADIFALRRALVEQSPTAASLWLEAASRRAAGDRGIGQMLGRRPLRPRSGRGRRPSTRCLRTIRNRQAQ